MKTANHVMALVALCMLGSKQLFAQGEVSGGFSSTKYDIYVVNDDESAHDAALRLQTRNGNSWSDWMIYQESTDKRLHFAHWDGSSHSNSNENDWERRPMTIEHTGHVGIGTTNPAYHMHVMGSVFADGDWLRVSGQRGLYFQTYGGGLYMTDNTWVRVSHGKHFYGGSNGVIRTDGELQVGGNGSQFRVQANGNTTVGGRLTLNTDAVGSAFYTQASNNGSGDYSGMKANNGNLIVGSDGNISFQETDDNVTRVFFDLNGNKVGIGNSNPSAMLDVSGSVKANQVTVSTGTFPDYVFADDYRLMPLAEVEAYIAAHGHLPNVPAAEVVVAEGMDLAAMNVVLMEKVEELTLYTLEQQKTLEAQAEAIAALQAALNQLLAE